MLVLLGATHDVGKGQLMQLEIGLTWVAVACYLLGCLLGWLGLVWRSDRLLRWVLPPLALGLVVHTLPIVLRWVRIEHGPYINAYEVLSASVWTGALLLLIMLVKRPGLRAMAGPVLGLSIVLLGWGVMSNPEVQPLPATFRGPWLLIHILFAKLAYGSILIANGVAVLFLVREKRAGSEPSAEHRASLKGLDRLAARLVAFGFIATTFMITAGSIWARNAWGRYWNWDPLETWSLVTWLAFGLFLHARLAFKVRGRLSAWAVLGLLLLCLLSFFLIAIVVPTVHNEFMVR